jgi:exopolysaccharide biosynthesis polyprenyl glycosylphosphotransferase
MFHRFSVNFAILSIALDATLVVAGMLVSGYIRPYLNAIPFALPIFGSVGWPGAAYVIFPMVWVGVFGVFSIYDGRRYLRAAMEFAGVTLASLLVGVALAGLLYLSFRETSRLLFLSFILLTLFSMFAWRAIARIYFRIRHEQLEGIHRVLVAGAGPVGREVQSQITRTSFSHLSLMGFLDDDLQKQRSSADVRGTLDDARRIIASLRVTDLVIALPQRAHERTNTLVQELVDVPVNIWVIPDYFHLTLHHAQVEDFAGIPMLDLRAPALTDYQRFVKRMFDLALGGFFLLIALPVMALVALSILLEDGRPVLFHQTRVGENGRMFEIHKFRTMLRNAEQLRHLVQQTAEDGNMLHKLRDDPRVTRLGRFLRRLSLDELPQLFNVLVGEMSLVGPRPELPYLVDKYEPWQRKRFAVPPGLTGWWQIHDRSDKPMHLHTEDDLYYIQNYSIALDIQILAKTIWAVLRGRGAY